MKGYSWRSWYKNASVIEQMEKSHFAVVFDTETNGLPGRNGLTEASVKIIQFSAMLIEYSGTEFKEIDRLNTYIFPGEEISEEITALTGITNEILAKAPNEKAVAPRILDFLSKANVWIGYNIGFDIARVKGMCLRQGYSFLLPGEEGSDVLMVDALSFARDCVTIKSIEEYKKSKGITKRGVYKLETIASMLFPDEEIYFHDSMEDVLATANVLFALVPIVKQQSCLSLSGEERVVVDNLTFGVRVKQPRKSREIRVWGTYKRTRLPLDIVWNLSNQEWTCHSNKEGKEQFKSIDFKDLEEQVLSFAINKGVYGKKYEPSLFEVPSMDALGMVVEKAFLESSDGRRFQAMVKREESKAKQTAKVLKYVSSFDVE